MEVVKDGIAIYQSDDAELARPKPQSPQQALDTAREYFEEYLPAGLRKHDLALEAQRRGYSKDAAFLFHQATESLYQGVLLTLTYYTPYNHNIARSVEHTSELQSLMRISYAVFCLKTQ